MKLISFAASHADRLLQQHREAPSGHHPDTGVGVAEARPLGCDEEVAVERDLESAGDRGPVDRADHRLVHVGERAARSRAWFLTVVDVGRAQVAGRRPELLQVEAGAEGRIGAGEDHDVDVVATVGLAHQLGQQAQHLRRQRVACLGPVQRDGGDPLRHLEQHGFDGHGRTSSSSGGRNSSLKSPSRTSVDAIHPPIALK